VIGLDPSIDGKREGEQQRRRDDGHDHQQSAYLRPGLGEDDHERCDEQWSVHPERSP
jgi:hypothetical protein